MTDKIAKNKVPNALEVIDLKLQALKDVSDASPKTNGEFRWNPNYNNGNSIMLHYVKDISLLINIHQYIRTKDEEYKKSAEILGVKEYPVFTWLGFSFEAWDHDIKQRIAIVTTHKEKKRLLDAKRKLENFLSEEDRLNMVLSELGLDNEVDVSDDA